MNGEEMFNDIKEASSFWKSLWKGNRTGNKKAAWLDELRAVIKKQVPTPIEEALKLDTSCMVKDLCMEEKLECNWIELSCQFLVETCSHLM